MFLTLRMKIIFLHNDSAKLNKCIVHMLTHILHSLCEFSLTLLICSFLQTFVNISIYSASSIGIFRMY